MRLSSRHKLSSAILIGYILVSYLLVDRSVALYEDSSHIINVAGQQRMLSQRIFLQFSLWSDSKQNEQQKINSSELRNLLTTFEQNHQVLKKSKFASQNDIVKQLYSQANGINQKMVVFVDAITRGLNQTSIKDQRFIDYEFVSELLIDLDNVVTALESQATQNIKTVRNVAMWLFLIGFMLIVIIYQFIFKAAQQQISENLDLLEKEKLIAQKEKLNAIEANEKKSIFLTNMSHELRTPLNAVLGFAQILSAEPERSENDKDMLIEIERAGKHLLLLLDDILQLGDIEQGKVRLSLEPVDMKDVVEYCFKLVSNLAKEKGVTLQLHCHEQEFVFGDKNRLQQVMLNLLSNAIKYNVEDGQVDVRCEKGLDDTCRIVVSDTGMGISKKDQQKIFEPFERLNMHEKAISGTGVGLSVVQGLTEAMKGHVSLTSDLGKGSEFSITLQKPDESALEARLQEITIQKINKQNSNQDINSNAFKVLYVEDNPFNLKLMDYVFEKHFAQVNLIKAVNGQLGVDLAKSNKPNLILLDINLPDIDGYHVLARLRRHPEFQNIPILAVSAYARESDIEKSRLAGFDDYITKPFSVDKLVELIRYHHDKQVGTFTSLDSDESLPSYT